MERAGRFPSSSYRIGIAAALIALAAIALATYVRCVSVPLLRTNDFQYDLTAFYCGGVAVAAHADPYRTEPLRSCERGLGTVLSAKSAFAIPDPLPAYDQGAFAALSRVPFALVFIAWPCLQVAAYATTCVLLVRLTGLRPLVVASALLLCDLYCSVALGQLSAFSILGLALAGRAIERQAPRALAIGLVLGAVEPHLGLPALVATIAFGRGRSVRLAALGAAAILAVASALALPPGTALEYVTRVASAHARSEVNNEDQFGAAYALHRLGLSEGAAVSVAACDYALTLLAGIAFARRATAGVGPALLVFAPPAFVLLGGPFVHITQMGAAVPAALLLAARGRRETTTAAHAALALLAVPWAAFTGVTALMPLAAGVLYVLTTQLPPPVRVRAGLVAAVALGSECLADFSLLALPGPVLPALRPALPADLAETLWKAVIDAQAHQHVLASALAKIPTELAIVLVIAAVMRVPPGGAGSTIDRTCRFARRSRRRTSALIRSRSERTEREDGDDGREREDHHQLDLVIDERLGRFGRLGATSRSSGVDVRKHEVGEDSPFLS